ncbi:MAG: phosphopantothenoylcysteine decarboxylase [Kiritimatiellaeota bacterium]|nr:phosphopantothenoylcysteine decarboxylase [Kiritimatiellota bacterium]
MNYLVTAGPTREFLDPVRYISNRSSGKMGYALAAAARKAGHAVTLITGPVALTPPEGVKVVPVVTALDMLTAVRAHLPKSEVVIMAAAVADFRPKFVSKTKLKKRTLRPVLTLVPNPDILQTIKPLKGKRLFVGFAAETDHLITEAKRKLEAKGLDLIVANDVTRADSGFDVDTNAVTLVAKGGNPRNLPVLTKTALAEGLVAMISHPRSTWADFRF